METLCIDLLSSYHLSLLKFVLPELNVNKGGDISQPGEKYLDDILS